jgi:hypothetical protein
MDEDEVYRPHCGTKSDTRSGTTIGTIIVARDTHQAVAVAGKHADLGVKVGSITR